MPKQEYPGRDFFQRAEFRGLLLADYQEAIGSKAYAQVEKLNKSSVQQFQALKGFKSAID